MKTIIKLTVVAVLVAGFTFASQAQQRSEKYEVTTHLKEQEGSYSQRKLYREFLVEYMKKCPYISHFSVHEAVGVSDNHEVVWEYEVGGWSDITQFYGWVKDQLSDSSDNGLKKALTPYHPDYALGGKINMQKRGHAAIAKD